MVIVSSPCSAGSSSASFSSAVGPVGEKDIELLVLRQELAIRRQVNRPRVKPGERMVLAVLQRLRPAWERTSSLVTRHAATSNSPSACGLVTVEAQPVDTIDAIGTGHLSPWCHQPDTNS